MTGLDCNILVQLALADHPFHAKTAEVVDAELKRRAILVFPPLVATEFLHVVTDDRRFSPPLTMAEAIEWVEELLENPSIRLIQPTDESFQQTLRWMRHFHLGRKRVLDAHLAALLHMHGVKRLITSNPGDFNVFGVFEIIIP